jgi:hypothetical protein
MWRSSDHCCSRQAPDAQTPGHGSRRLIRGEPAPGANRSGLAAWRRGFPAAMGRSATAATRPPVGPGTASACAAGNRHGRARLETGPRGQPRAPPITAELRAASGATANARRAALSRGRRSAGGRALAGGHPFAVRAAEPGVGLPQREPREPRRPGHCSCSCLRSAQARDQAQCPAGPARPAEDSAGQVGSAHQPGQA